MGQCRACGWRPCTPSCESMAQRMHVAKRREAERKEQSDAYLVAQGVVEMVPCYPKKDQRKLILKRLATSFSSLSVSERRKIAAEVLSA